MYLSRPGISPHLGAGSDRASNRRKAAGALSVVDPAELRLAVCLSRRYDPIVRPFGNESDGYSGPEGTAAGVIESSEFDELRATMFRYSRSVPKLRTGPMHCLVVQ
jgi:hypothetical protein